MSVQDETWDRECPKCGAHVPYGGFAVHRYTCPGVHPLQKPIIPSRLETMERLLRHLRANVNCYVPPPVLKEIDDFLNQK